MKIRIAIPLVLLLFNPFSAHSVETNRGTDIMGPPTMNHPSYPNSGQLRNRSNDMTGEDMSNASLMGSGEDPRVPDQNPQREEEDTRAIKTGPYDDHHRHHPESGPQGVKAKEAVKSGELELNKQEMRKKQKGE